MKILVCIKQVPETTEIALDPLTNTLNRNGVPNIVNPFDRYALEMALRLKEKHGGKITVISMGPHAARNALKECLAAGADHAVLISDTAFGGSDTYATSYILSRAIMKLDNFDIIFCGKQAVDGDTGQVGPEIAEHLDMAQITCAKSVTINGNLVRVQREQENGTAIIEAAMPVLITVIKNSQHPRMPTLKSKLAANNAKIQILDTVELGIDLAFVGLTGSPTKVKKTFISIKKRSGVIISGTGVDESVKQLVSVLKEKQLV
jgi:electron transfer flavoprotein alpha/beta subunit